MLLNAVPIAMPRARPVAGAVDQLASFAAALSTAIQRGSVSRARRNVYGSSPAAVASSSIADSTPNVFSDAPTERQKPTGIGDGCVTYSVTRAPKLYGRPCDAS